MTPFAERALTVTIIACAVGAWAYYTLVIDPERMRHRSDARKAEFSQRFKDWAYVAKQKEIAPGETIKLVVVPDSMGIISTKCFVYTHREFKTSSMICPDAKQEDIEEKAE